MNPLLFFFFAIALTFAILALIYAFACLRVRYWKWRLSKEQERHDQLLSELELLEIQTRIKK